MAARTHGCRFEVNRKPVRWASDFEGKPLGTGDMTIPPGDSVTFRYRFVFHEGSPAHADVERHWKRYAEANGPSD